ncbi:hypothetical protein NGM37_32405, partial [Streptomyces sp. TRM76130]|nr:hypothetical protein [Streptomyces sp. TRM76130]
MADLQARHDQATARAGELRGQIERFTAALAEADPRETSTAYQAIVNAFNQHPDRKFRARE